MSRLLTGTAGATTEMPEETHSPKGQDYLVERDGVLYAGSHLLIDLWDGEKLDDLDHIDATLRAAVAAADATLLRIDLHRFDENGGVSGVAILAESHLSIHTWPELGYAAIDAFMCGRCDPKRTLPVLKERFKPSHMEVIEQLRGRRQ